MAPVTIHTLSKELAIEMSWTKIDSKQFIEDVFIWIKGQLLSGFKVKLKNFGVFSLPYRKKKSALHPITKERLIISERRSPLFQASKLLLKRINKKGD